MLSVIGPIVVVIGVNAVFSVVGPIVVVVVGVDVAGSDLVGPIVVVIPGVVIDCVLVPAVDAVGVNVEVFIVRAALEVPDIILVDVTVLVVGENVVERLSAFVASDVEVPSLDVVVVPGMVGVVLTVMCSVVQVVLV